MKKKILAIALALVLALGMLMPAAAESRFSDLENHWAISYIEKWADKGVINGYPDGTFRPDQDITRSEVAKVLALAYEMPLDITSHSFSDVEEGIWYYAHVQACAEYEVINGYPDGTFQPNASITRNEAVKMVCLAAGLTEKDTGLESKPDYDQIPDWAKGYWNALYHAGVIDGYEDGYLRPNQNITRAELIKILCKAFSEVQIYEFTVTIEDNLGNKVTDGTSYLTGDSRVVEILVPLLVANRNNFAAAFPSGHMRDLLDEGIALAKAGYADGWIEEELAAWQSYIDNKFANATGDPSAIKYISNVESTINTMKMDVGYIAQFYDTDPGREDIQYTITITCSVMD